MIRRIGMDRNAMIGFMRGFLEDDRYLAVDLTHVLSMSEGIISAALGHNSMGEFLPQVQVPFLFSLDHERSAYFRILPESINSVASLKMTVTESNVSNVVLVADSGFYSAGNIKDLDDLGVSYIIPLKRNSRIIYYDHGKEKHFMFQDHPIFYWKYSSGNHAVITFRNDFQKAEEENDFLRHNVKETSFSKIRERIHPATPKEDAHIKSFNSILEKEVIRRFEFSSFKDADNTISRFISFYNNERLHSAIDYRTPREVYE